MTPEREHEISAVSGAVGPSVTGDPLVGQRIGPYEVVAFLAAGGMGRVYRARDTKLPRDVALKVLPPDFVRDPERRGRFEREARVLATLAHPHINKIFYRIGNRMMAVELSTSPDVVLSTPRTLFERRYGFGPAATMPNFDVTPDGQRFVMVKNEPLAERLNIVVNWFANGFDER